VKEAAGFNAGGNSWLGIRGNEAASRPVAAKGRGEARVAAI
jgi:hypothetical protein